MEIRGIDVEILDKLLQQLIDKGAVYSYTLIDKNIIDFKLAKYVDQKKEVLLLLVSE